MSKKLTLILILVGVLIAGFNFQIKPVKAADQPIYSLFVSGKVTIEEEDGYARIILVDENSREYLVHQVAGPFDSGTISFTNKCEETCVLDGIVPKKVKVEVDGATVKIDKVDYLKDKKALKSEILSVGIEDYENRLDQKQEQTKIEEINQYIKENNLDWKAEETSISTLSYHQKKERSIQDLSPSQKLQSGSLQGAPSYFDWRDKNDLNYTTRAKNQEEPHSCGSCWIFATLAAIESQIEIDYDIPERNPDLSEQDAISCSEVGGCGGGGKNDTPGLLTHIKQEGVTTEQCFPYTGIDSGGCPLASCGLEPTLCEEKCDQWWEGGWKINSYSELSPTNEADIKQALTSGPLITLIRYCPDFANYKGGIYETSYGICNFGHAILLVGYGEKDGETYWIGKNSWGENWGENGFFRAYSGSFEINNLYQVNSPQPLEPSKELKVDCTAVPRKVKVGEEVIFKSSVVGGTGSYSYRWSGACQGSSKNCTITFSEFGFYEAELVVTSGDQQKEAECSASVAKKECDCTDWTDQSCGGNDCSQDRMWQTRDCTQTDCLESRCVDDPSCEEEECPDCWGKTDECEDPPRCEEECGAPPECDEKKPDFIWTSDNYCNYCDSFCNYDFEIGKPIDHYSSEGKCYYNCPVECTPSGWERKDYNCESESCPKFKEVNNKCYYNERCTGYGCKYSNSESKPCPKATCTKSGWDILKCEVCPDVDNDGYQANHCGGNDCCDIDAEVHPGATWHAEKNNCGNYEYDCEGAENFLGTRGKCKCDNGKFTGTVGWKRSALSADIPNCGKSRKWFDGENCHNEWHGPVCSGTQKVQQCGSGFEQKKLTKEGKCKCDNGNFTGDEGWKNALLAPHVPNCGGKRKYFIGRDEDGDGKECSSGWLGPSCDGRQMTQSCR